MSRSLFGLTSETLDIFPDGAKLVSNKRIKISAEGIQGSEDGRPHLLKQQILHAERLFKILYPDMFYLDSDQNVPISMLDQPSNYFQTFDGKERKFEKVHLGINYFDIYDLSRIPQYFGDVNKFFNSKVAIEGSGTGTGKTICDLNVASASGCKHIIVFTTASMKSKWDIQSRSIGINVMVYSYSALSSGCTGFNGEESLVKIQKVPVGETKVKKVSKVTKFMRKLSENGCFIIADEASALKNANSTCSKSFLAICDLINFKSHPRSRILIASASLNDVENNLTVFISYFGFYGPKKVRGDTMLPYVAERIGFGQIRYDKNGIYNISSIFEKIYGKNPFISDMDSFLRVAVEIEKLKKSPYKMSIKMCHRFFRSVYFDIISKYMFSGMDPLPNPICYKLFMENLFSRKHIEAYTSITNKAKEELKMLKNGEKEVSFIEIMNRTFNLMEDLKTKYLLKIIINIFQEFPRRKFVIAYTTKSSALLCKEILFSMPDLNIDIFYVDGTVPIPDRPGIISDFKGTNRGAVLITTSVLGMGQDIDLTIENCDDDYKEYIASDEYKRRIPSNFRDAENQITIFIMPGYRVIDIIQMSGRNKRRNTIGEPITIILYFNSLADHFYNIVKNKTKVVSDSAVKGSISLDYAPIVSCINGNFREGEIKEQYRPDIHTVKIGVYDSFMKEEVDRRNPIRPTQVPFSMEQKPKFLSVSFTDSNEKLRRVIIRTDSDVFFIRLVYMSRFSLKLIIKKYLKMIKSSVKIDRILDKFQFENPDVSAYPLSVTIEGYSNTVTSYSGYDSVVPSGSCSDYSCTSSSTSSVVSTHPYIERYREDIEFFMKNYNFTYPGIGIERR